MKQGSLTIISGFSGAGKGTIIRRLLEKYPDYVLSISCTTRAPRPGEEEAHAYEFVSQEEFNRRVEEDELLEHAGYVGHSYGTPRKFVEEKIREGKDVLLEIEVQGAKIVRQKLPETILLFVTPESAQVLQNRLSGRGTEDAATVHGRLSQAAREVEEMAHYDAIIINREGQLEKAVDDVHHAIQTLKQTPLRQRPFIEDIRGGLHELQRAYQAR